MSTLEPTRSETKYAHSGDVHIAYQVVGEGPIDIVYVPGWVSNVELCWSEPIYADFLNRLASFSRLILFDKRGTGLSDRVTNDNLPTLEERMQDVLVVLDAVGSKKAAIFGFSEGGSLSAYFAASVPDRVSALILFGTFAKRIWNPDYPWAPTTEERALEIKDVENNWGEGMNLNHYAPSVAHDEAFKSRLRTYLRGSASPGAAMALLKMNTEIDISGILHSIHVPTLLLHRVGDLDAKIEEARWISERIPDAHLIELDGADHFPWVGDQGPIVEEIQKFLTGELSEPEPTRVLASILFTDIVSSTEQARKLGDSAWKSLLNRHDQMCRETVTKCRGRHFKNTGDGILATFDGPGRGISCAQSIIEKGREIGLEIRSGMHTGECELRGDELSGVAVHLSARVAAQAQGGEVLVSRTVRDLVAGSRHSFEPRGDFRLKGFDEDWALYSVA